ncbi:MAG TPA: MarC family protein [Elusimicrobiota bacterium]|nr:MarC family protein [Elusimicrobiota bacterium]
MTALEYGLMATSSLFAIINPVAAIPAFLAMTPNDGTESRLRMARRACATCAGVLLVFGLAGRFLFKVFGISLPSFQMAGGIVLLVVSLDSIRAKRSPVQETEEETEEGVGKDDISITPLAIPMLSGPGAITTVIVLESKAGSALDHVLLFAAVLGVSAASYAAFHMGVTGARRLSPILMNITTRLMGLILVATAVEFIVGGLRALGPLR